MPNPLFIGITAYEKKLAVNFSQRQSICSLALTYIQLIKDYDCLPIIIPACATPQTATDYMQILSGLILPSGPDIAPQHYGQAALVTYSESIASIGTAFNRPKMMAHNLKIDETELALYAAAKQANVPILGICRGMQLINVAEGGTLHQEIPTSDVPHFLDEDGWVNHHPLEINMHSRCYQILQTQQVVTSSIHHQAIDELGKNLAIAAVAPDGIIEMIEHENKNHFIVGVQGHIEKTRKSLPWFEKIISAFMQAVIHRSQWS